MVLITEKNGKNFLKKKKMENAKIWWKRFADI